jgi:hypothetical protein
VALWREALLAKAVLGGRTRGYRHHPQLSRFRGLPASAINCYLREIQIEATARGYRFDRTKVGPVRAAVVMRSTDGQVGYEWRHLMRKLRERSPEIHRKWRKTGNPEPHPLFAVVKGGVEDWERR